MAYKASFVLVIIIIIFAFIRSNAKSPAEIYWKSKVGNIPIPKTLKSSLQQGSYDEIVKLYTNYKNIFVNEDPLSNNLANQDCLFYWYSGGKQVHKCQIPHDGRVVFFTYDTLSSVGTKMKLHFKKIDNEAKFLPLHIAKSMPATSDKLQVILNLLSINPKSILAQNIEITLKQCEDKGVKDEKRYCAPSLEGMIDYVTSILNSRKSKLMALSTKVDNDMFMEYTIRKVQKLGTNNYRNVVCHRMNNPYVVFLCHNIKKTNLYDVSLIGVNGKQMTAVAVCHEDTSSWDPSHHAFKILKSKPGGKPICHFASADAIVWFET